MGFADQLRMRNLFPTDIGPPSMGDDGVGLFKALANIVNPPDTGNEITLNPNAEQRGPNRLASLAADSLKPQQPMNVLLGNQNTMTPYQRSQIELGRERINASRDNTNVRNAYRDDEVAIKRDIADLKLKNDNLTAADKARQAAETAGKKIESTEKVADKRIESTEKVAGQKIEADATNLGTRNDAAAALERQRQGGRMELAGLREGDIGSITDPNDPTKQISIWFNPATKKIERVKLDNEDVPPITKPSTKAPDPLATANRERVKTMTEETLNSLNELVDEKGGLKSNVATAVGTSRWLDPRNYIPGTEAKTGNRKLENFLSKQVLGIIGEMKSQSKTGATGFGALNMKELGVLEKAANSIDPDMPDEDIAKELGKIKERLIKILEDEGPKERMVKTQTNPRTGEKREVESLDGGATWQPTK